MHDGEIHTKQERYRVLQRRKGNSKALLGDSEQRLEVRER